MDRSKTKRALVIGGAGGVGRAVVERLAADGHTVVVADQASAEVPASFSHVPIDVTSYDESCRAVDTAARQLGGIDVLINCVGWNQHSRFEDQTPDFWHRVLAINLEGHLFTAHAAIPHLKEAGGGAIVMVASDAGRVGTSGEAAYSAAKGGVIAFTKSLARELVRYRIRVNCVAPGPTDTPMLRGAMNDEPAVLERMVRAIPMRRIADPAEQASVIAFLAGDGASYVTGQVLSVNGGLAMV